MRVLLVGSGAREHAIGAAIARAGAELAVASANLNPGLAELTGKDRYFGVIDLIFRNQPTWAVASDPIAELAKPLRIAGLGENEIKACLADEAKANEVIADYRGGETLGVDSTPSLFIDGQLYRGPRSVEELDAAFGKLAK